jgi:hypothetical protein
MSAGLSPTEDRVCAILQQSVGQRAAVSRSARHCTDIATQVERVVGRDQRAASLSSLHDDREPAERRDDPAAPWKDAGAAGPHGNWDDDTALGDSRVQRPVANRIGDVDAGAYHAADVPPRASGTTRGRVYPACHSAHHAHASGAERAGQRVRSPYGVAPCADNGDRRPSQHGQIAEHARYGGGSTSSSCSG